jgi:poly(glycerol-phosphate) alpha-glucosyltransferase
LTVVPVPLPPGRQFALTWALTREFGGMTGAMLRRSQVFARLAGAPVDVLTFDLRNDYADIVAHLRRQGRLDESTRVRNLWDELTEESARRPPAKGAKAAALERFNPLPAIAAGTHERRAEDGSLLQVDRRRADGSLAISDIRDTRQRGTLGGRSIVLCDDHGSPVFGFTRAWPFYRWWIDEVVGDEDAFLVVDSKTTANFLVGYRNARATVVHVVHNSHLEGEKRPWSGVKVARQGVLTHLEDFDAVVVLSERQREDIRLLLGPADSLEVVPNSAPLPDAAPSDPRNPDLGVVLASLDERKRVDHAVRAIAAARRAGAPARLDVYGDGHLHENLVHLIDELGLGDAVRLLGFRPDALRAFETASFFLLTSTSEGFPLVLAEGMSRGSLPLSYDVPYGPADIVADGVNGFLVPPGDVAALAARIRQVVADPAGTEALRAAAAAAAARFSERTVLERWSTVLERARERQRRPRPRFELALRTGEVSHTDSTLSAVADFAIRGSNVSPGDVAASIALHGPRDSLSAVELRAAATVRRTLRHGVWRARADFPAEAARWLPTGTPLTGELELRIGAAVQRGHFEP